MHIQTSTRTDALAVAHVHAGNRSAGRVREVTPVSHGQGKSGTGHATGPPFSLATVRRHRAARAAGTANPP